ncbi:UxaA family hydrolase [Desulfitibacter alkalitolerans]|uniref:UxaA family hydrolase n=1 Tax=Desulfitibacter alkalitolerans TaxID=264641 RepID=UPI0004842E27|nr:altronate dehydratase family protein [Desulfitibacter alkalitolerans]
MRLIRIHEKDNVAIALDAVQKGSQATVGNQTIYISEDIGKGHKIAIKDVPKDSEIIKYGFPIGKASVDIHLGSWVHDHNLKTGLGDILSYEYKPSLKPQKVVKCMNFKGFKRPDGKVGVRNEIWIIPTVSCVNRNAELIERAAVEKFKDSCQGIDGIYTLKHPYGCSQLGDDHLNTQKILANLVKHPNAAAVLVLGLGCENNNVDEFKRVLKDYDVNRVKFLEAQEVEDEITEGTALIEKLINYAKEFSRQDCSIDYLSIGLKCGGSDAFSGLTGNPLLGAFSDRLIECGGTSVLTEVPEMFGAETILLNRCANEEVFNKAVELINGFKEYFNSYNQPIYENPSPGNKAGGISTLEEKSLGCVQKGGIGNIVDVLQYGELLQKNGLNLLNSPGNDMVASTALAAAGCQIILFTSGRGTPLGTCVPTIKIATNSEIFKQKNNWMDFDAGPIISGKNIDNVLEDFWDYVIEVAEGKSTKSEILGFREIAIFKSGVTL